MIRFQGPRDLFRNFAACGVVALAAMSLGCASYKGSATAVQPSAVPDRRDWVMVQHFPLELQQGSKDCGAAALSAVLRFWGRSATAETIEASVGRAGQRLRAGDIERYAKSAGLSSFVFFGTMQDVVYEVDHGRPVIVGLGKSYQGNKAVSHYEVVVGYEPRKRQVLLLDPGRGWQIDSFDGFAREWAVSKGVTVVAFAPDSDRRVSER